MAPEIQAFLSSVAARPDISNWQIQQARDAVELYYERFRGIPLDPRLERPVPPPSRAAVPLTPPSAASPARGTVTLARGYADGDEPVKREARASGRGDRTTDKPMPPH